MTNTFALLGRLSPSGSLDASFPGVDCSVPFLLNYCAVNSLAVQPDGKILIGGLFPGIGFARDIERRNADGSLDVSFDVGVDRNVTGGG